MRGLRSSVNSAASARARSTNRSTPRSSPCRGLESSPTGRGAPPSGPRTASGDERRVKSSGRTVLPERAAGSPRPRSGRQGSLPLSGPERRRQPHHGRRRQECRENSVPVHRCLRASRVDGRRNWRAGEEKALGVRWRRRYALAWCRHADACSRGPCAMRGAVAAGSADAASASLPGGYDSPPSLGEDREHDGRAPARCGSARHPVCRLEHMIRTAPIATATRELPTLPAVRAWESLGGATPVRVDQLRKATRTKPVLTGPARTARGAAGPGPVARRQRQPALPRG